MKIHLREALQNPEVKILDIEGRIDGYTHSIIQDEITTLLKIGNSKLVCNMVRVDHIGPAGLRFFLQAVKHARESGGDIKFCGLVAGVQKTFEFAGFQKICQFFPSPEEAVQEFGGENLSEKELYQDTVEATSEEGEDLDVDLRGQTFIGDPREVGEVNKGKQTEKIAAVQRDRETQKMDPFKYRIQENNIMDNLHQFGDEIDTKKMESLPSPSQSPPLTHDVTARIVKAADTGKVERNFEKILQDDEETFGDSVSTNQMTLAAIPSDMEQTIVQQIANMEKSEKKEESEDRSFNYSNKYLIHKKLADGNLGKMYLGEEQAGYEFSRKVVLKYIKNQYAKSENLATILRELHQIYPITHPNFAKLLSVVSLKEYPFVVMEYVDGMSLASGIMQLKEKRKAFPKYVATFIIYQLCSALHQANQLKNANISSPIVHGEINPHNIIISKNREVKLVNLGLAKANLSILLQSDPRKVKNLQYIAPEIIASGQPNVTSDIFSLGVLFYELLTGIKPFSEDQIKCQSLDLPKPPSLYNRRVNNILDGIIFRCLFEDPYRRFQGYRDLAMQLEDFLYDKGFFLTKASLDHFLQNSGFHEFL